VQTTEAPSKGAAERPALLVSMYRQMWRIRAFDERAMELYRDGLMRGTTHPYIGEEAVAAAACAALREDDYITSTHRGHGHCIAKGGDLKLMMAELLGKSTGYCHGKGGSMHIADLGRGILGANGVVGGGIAIAGGAALAAHLRRSSQVTVCFFGDGALNQGILHESMNLAAIWKLPIVFLCENNQYAMSSRAQHFTAAADPSIRGQGYGMPSYNVDGMEALAVFDTVRECVERARKGGGPSFVVATCYRFYGHHVGDPLNYREKEEVERWRERDPILLLEQAALAADAFGPSQAARLQAEARAEVEAAVEFARQSPEPDLAAALQDVYTP
jgi:TPP-dependent pyruvate/acetoin dehydrogenase alpha subunit